MLPSPSSPTPLSPMILCGSQLRPNRGVFHRHPADPCPTTACGFLYEGLIRAVQRKRTGATFSVCSNHRGVWSCGTSDLAPNEDGLFRPGEMLSPPAGLQMGSVLRAQRGSETAGARAPVAQAPDHSTQVSTKTGFPSNKQAAYSAGSGSGLVTRMSSM